MKCLAFQNSKITFGAGVHPAKTPRGTRPAAPHNDGNACYGDWYTDIMSALYSDTHPKIEALQIQLWRQASPTRKMHMLAQLNASARMLALAGLRSRYPNA